MLVVYVLRCVVLILFDTLPFCEAARGVRERHRSPAGISKDRLDRLLR